MASIASAPPKSERLSTSLSKDIPDVLRRYDALGSSAHGKFLGILLKSQGVAVDPETPVLSGMGISECGEFVVVNLKVLEWEPEGRPLFETLTVQNFEEMRQRLGMPYEEALNLISRPGKMKILKDCTCKVPFVRMETFVRKYEAEAALLANN